jgi:DTW domain-containing protein YfiP
MPSLLTCSLQLEPNKPLIQLENNIMRRASCTVCLRPQKTCICHLFLNIDNNIDVIILQHPTEVKQTKGTVTLLANSLQNCNVVVGEDFTNDEVLNHLLQQYKSGLYLLYPSDMATVISPLNNVDDAEYAGKDVTPVIDSGTVKCIILIDGTWKKSYKMYMLNTFLHAIPHLTLPESTEGNYQIRKTQKSNALSSLEACTYALMMLESNDSKYEQLLSSFKQFNDVQMSYRK